MPSASSVRILSCCCKSHGLVGINLTEVPPEWAKMRTHFGIISPMNKPLPPLAQLMVDTIIDADRDEPPDRQDTH